MEVDVDVDSAWLPAQAWRPIGSRRVRVDGDGPLVDTVREEVTRAGAALVRDGADLVLSTVADTGDGFALSRADGVTTVAADGPAGLLYGLFHVVRLGESAFGGDRPPEHHRPAIRRRMLNHWDNVDVHPVMGQVERGYGQPINGRES